MADVTRADIARLHLAMKDKPYQGNRTLALSVKVLQLGGAIWLPRRRLKSLPTHRQISRAAARAVPQLSRTGAAGRGSCRRRAARENVAFHHRCDPTAGTRPGARLSEILTLRWQDVDFDGASLRLPDSKTGKKSIYLNPPALQVLSSLQRGADNPYVIQGERAGAHLVNLQKPWRRIRKAAGLDDVRIHDLRHSFASDRGGERAVPLHHWLPAWAQPAADHIPLRPLVRRPPQSRQRRCWRAYWQCDEVAARAVVTL